MHRSEVFQQDEAPEDTPQAGSAGVHFSHFFPPVLIFLSIHKTTAPVAVCPLQTHLLRGTGFALTALSRISPLCAHAGE